MIRTILGPLLSLAGAAAAVWSPFLDWYDSRQGSDIRVDDLFTDVGVTPHDAALLGSLFLPMGFAALLTLLGLLLRSRLAVALAGVLVLGATVLWMVRQAQFSHSLTAGGDGLDTGVAAAVAGGLLLFAGGCLLPGRRPPRFGEPRPVGGAVGDPADGAAGDPMSGGVARPVDGPMDGPEVGPVDGPVDVWGEGLPDGRDDEPVDGATGRPMNGVEDDRTE
jgi:hypothetical protein